MGVSERDRAVAEQIASEVRALTAWRRTWRRVTTLLDYFGASHLTDGVRARIQDALESVGLEVEPSLRDVERYGTVRLSLRDGAVGDDRQAPMFRIWIWQPGHDPVIQEPEELLGEDLDPDALLWIDVDVTSAEAGPLLAALQPICGANLTESMVTDLLSADAVPKVASYGDLRSASAFAVEAREREETADIGDSKAGELVFRLVEFLVSSRWLVTCWHAPTTSTGVTDALGAAVVDQEEVLENVAVRWRMHRVADFGKRSSAGDLAMLVLHELARSYSPARRTLYAWLELWELDFYRHRERTETKTLVDLRRGIADMRERLAPLNVTGVRENPDRAWFPAVTDVEEAVRVDELIDRALRDLRALGDALLASSALVSSVGAAEQARQAERFQRLLAAVAAVLLVPTLVATVFGANTALPGGQRWTGFLLMVSLMALTALATWFLIRWLQRPEPSDEATSPPVSAGGSPSASERPGVRNAAIVLYDHVARDQASRSPELLRLFAASEPLTPKEIGDRLRPNDDGSRLTKHQARAVLRNLGRAQGGLLRSGAIDREVLVKDFARYEVEGAGRYGLSDVDRAALKEHL